MAPKFGPVYSLEIFNVNVQGEVYFHRPRRKNEFLSLLQRRKSVYICVFFRDDKEQGIKT